MYNTNNYGYNPYGTYMPQRPMIQQPIQQNPVINTPTPVMNGLNGKQVDSIDVVKATDIPMDGSISYFPLTDGSGIITKQIQLDGTSKIIVFKPSDEQESKTKYITSEDMKKALEGLNIDELEESINDIKSELKDLKKKKKDD